MFCNWIRKTNIILRIKNEQTERRNYQENDYSGSRNAPYRGRNERGSRGGRAMRPRGRGY